jgi:LPXTG-site transpeptidase (sortase) family protein
MQSKKIIQFLIFRTLSNFFILITIFGVLATFGPAIFYEAEFRYEKVFGVEYAIADISETDQTPSELGALLDKYQNTPGELTEDEQSMLGVILSENKEKILVPKSSQFSIVIPKIGANSNVIENVDPDNEQEYLSALGRGVAHARGTAFPGMNGNIYLFAHSADSFWNVGRYNAIFYLLKELQSGDDISVFFQGRRYNYVVKESKIVEPEEVQYLQANIGAGEQLILQTCWPPGTTWKRQLVFATPK